MSTTHHDLQSTATGIQQPSSTLRKPTKEDLRSLRASFRSHLKLYYKIKKNPIDLLSSLSFDEQLNCLMNDVKSIKYPFLQLYTATILMAATDNVRETILGENFACEGCMLQDFNLASNALKDFDEAIDTALLPIIAEKIPQQDVPGAVQFLEEMKNGKNNAPYIRRVQKALYACHGIPMPRTYANRLSPGVLPRQARLTA